MFFSCVWKERKEHRIMEKRQTFSVMYLLLLNLVGCCLRGFSMVVFFYMLIWNQTLCWVVVI